MKIIRTQFTRYDAELHPECNNNQYLEYETIKTRLSQGIIAYGYQRIEGTKYKWIRKNNPLTDVYFKELNESKNRK